jgi:CxxC-x17-CxxC domain-containing protein
MQFADRDLKCLSCGAEFVFSSGEQQFFHDSGFANDPKLCKQCKVKRAGVGRVRPETQVQCSACGIATTVPFKPTQQRPVLCRTCFNTEKTAPAQAPKVEVLAKPVS